MEWTSEQSAIAFVGKPNGRVDEASWEAFHAAALGAVAQAGTVKLPLIIDLAGIDYMSSRGLRVLTLIKREAEAKQVTLSLARPNERMREILAISRYDKIFDISTTLET